MKIRYYRAEDLPFVKEMVYEAIYWRSIKEVNLKERLSNPSVLKAIKALDQKEGDLVLIGEVDGEAAGMVFIRQGSQEDHIRGYIHEGMPVLVIGVHKRFRRQHVASMLMDALFQEASLRGINKISLSVSKDNPALSLYEKNGFVLHHESEDSKWMIKEVNKRLYFHATERIAYSTWQRADIDLALRLWGDPVVTKLIDIRDHLSYEAVQDKLDTEIRRYDKHHLQYFPIFLKASETFIGCCGLRPYKEKEGEYEIGIHLCHEYWHEGYGTEALEGMIKYARTEASVKTLFAGHHPLNLASKKLLLKMGFKYSHDELYEPTGLLHPSYQLTF